MEDLIFLFWEIFKISGSIPSEGAVTGEPSVNTEQTDYCAQVLGKFLASRDSVIRAILETPYVYRDEWTGEMRQHRFTITKSILQDVATFMAQCQGYGCDINYFW